MRKEIIMGLFSKKKKEFTVTLASGESFTCDSETTVLQAGLDNGLKYPHRCRVGSCTSCKTKLRDGKVKELTDSAYVLSMEEIKENTILACQSIPKTDLSIEVSLGEVEADTFNGKIVRIEDLTHDIKGVTVQLDKKMYYEAGQYCDIMMNGLDRPRNYSFAARSPSQGTQEIKLHIRKVPGGKFTEWLFESNKTGEVLEISGPYGTFTVSNEKSPMIFIAGGSGMAPILSMLESAEGDTLNRPGTYFFGARTQADLYALADVERAVKKWKADFKFVPVLSHEPEDSDWQGERGLVTDLLDSINLEGSEGYLCGPPGMIDAAIEKLEAGGVSSDRIYFDKFTDASHLATA